ncbi:MAG: 4'-phosphopantetheinyl transferase superfamily protein [Halioglobus sp.]
MVLRAPSERETLVYLWDFKSAGAETLHALSHFLCAEEKEHQNHFGQQSLRDRYTFCRAILRWHLGTLLAADPAAIAISTNENGKPLLDTSAQTLHFNYSHSGDYVALAFNSAAEVGIDIEYTTRVRNFMGIAESYFSESEFAQMRAAPAAKQHALFYTIWTLKEAYLKARGEGIFAGLDNFSFELGIDNPEAIKLATSLEPDRAKQRWHFSSTAPLAHYQLAVAVRTGSQQTVNTHIGNKEALLAQLNI